MIQTIRNRPSTNRDIFICPRRIPIRISPVTYILGFFFNKEWYYHIIIENIMVAFSIKQCPSSVCGRRQFSICSCGFLFLINIFKIIIWQKVDSQSELSPKVILSKIAIRTSKFMYKQILHDVVYSIIQRTFTKLTSKLVAKIYHTLMQ